MLINESQRDEIRRVIEGKLSLYSTEKDSRVYAYSKRIDYYAGAIKPDTNAGHEQIITKMCQPIADKGAAYIGANCFDINITADDITNDADNELAQSAEDTANKIYDSTNKELWFLGANEVASRLGDGVVVMEKVNGVPNIYHVENPGNVYFGWRTDNAQELEWWAYEYGISPEAARDRFKETLSPDGSLGQLEGGIAATSHSDAYGVTTINDAINESMSYSEKEDRWVRITLFTTFIDIRGEDGDILIPRDKEIVLANGTPFEINDGKYMYHFKANSYPGLPTGVCDFENVASLVTMYDKKLSEEADAVSQAVNPKYVTTDRNIEKIKQKLTPNKSQIILKQDKDTVFDVLNMQSNSFNSEPLIKNLMNQIRTNTGLQELGQDQISPNISGKALAYVYQGIIQNVTKKRIRWNKIIKDMTIDLLWMFCQDHQDMKEAYFDEDGSFKFKVNVLWNDVLESDKATKIANLLNLKNAKVISGYTAMQQADIADPTSEQKRIDEEQQKDLEFQQKLQQSAQQGAQQNQPTGPIMDESMNQPGEGIAAAPGNAGTSQTGGMSAQGAANQSMNNGGL